MKLIENKGGKKMSNEKNKKPGSKGCLWHWGNQVTLKDLNIETPGPQAKIHPLTQKAPE